MKGCIESLEVLQSDLDFAIQITSTDRYLSRSKGLHRKVGTSGNTLRSAILKEYLDSYKNSIKDAEVENDGTENLLNDDAENLLENTPETTVDSTKSVEEVEEVNGSSFLDLVRESIKGNTQDESVADTVDDSSEVEEVSSNSFLSAVRGNTSTAPTPKEPISEPVIPTVNLEELLGLTPSKSNSDEESYKRHGIYVESIVRRRKHKEARRKRMEERSKRFANREFNRSSRTRERFNYTSNGKFVEDVVASSSKSLVNGTDGIQPVVEDSSVYVNHGKYAEDIVANYSENSKEDVDIIQPMVDDVSSYVDHGSYVEDIISRQPVTDISEVPVDAEDSSNSIDNLWDDEAKEPVTAEGTGSSTDSIWEDVDEEPVVIDSENKKNNLENENIDALLGLVESENKNSNQKVKTESITNLENNSSDLEKEKSGSVASNLDLEAEKSDSENEKIDVPKDIRTFLKSHPSSTVEFVARYYPKKEIEKQLALGRIYKRKGKLMI